MWSGQFAEPKDMSALKARKIVTAPYVSIERDCSWRNSPRLIKMEKDYSIKLKTLRVKAIDKNRPYSLFKQVLIK